MKIGLMRRFVFGCGVAVLSLCLNAEVKWLEKDYDFGLMKEIAGPQRGVSRFVNVGRDTISIFNVRPSCGCTSAEWSDAPIAPGDTSTVAYTYDPEMRPGKFDKSVKVLLSDGTHHSIRITGNVYGTPESLASLYPAEAGELRLSEVALNMGEVKYGRRPLGFVNAYCLATDSIIPTVSSTVAGLSASPSQKKAGPGDLITYTVTFDTQACGEYGPLEGELTFGTPEGEGSIPWKAFVVPDADLLARTAGAKSGVCEIAPEPVDLGVIDMAEGSKPVTAEIKVSNAGKGALEIYRVVPGSDAIELSGLPRTIKPGKSVKVKVTVDPSRLNEGPARIPVTFITSDIRNPLLDMHVSLYAGTPK